MKATIDWETSRVYSCTSETRWFHADMPLKFELTVRHPRRWRTVQIIVTPRSATMIIHDQTEEEKDDDEEEI